MKKKTATPIHKLTSGDFVWTNGKQGVVKIMCLEDYEETKQNIIPHVKFLVGDTCEKIPVGCVTLEKDEWTDQFETSFMSYFWRESENELVNALQETFDKEIIEALSKKLIK